MEKSTYPAIERVFRIDDECYIVYLGSDIEDYKPFLRIGNSKKLKDEVISNTHNIVVTESYTGNPVLEPQNLNKLDLHANRYVGEKGTVDRFLKFLENYSIETKNVAHYHDVKTENHKAMLFMYDNGNLTLFYDKKLLFDLKNREKKDLHFIEKTIWIKDQLAKDPFRYLPDNFTGPGFIIIKNTLLLYNRNKLTAFDLPDEYFYSLAQSGIDPDLISTVVTDVVSDDMINLCKRKKYRKENLNILSGNITFLQSALRLFTEKKPYPLKADIKPLSGTEYRTADNLKIKKTEQGYLIAIDSIPFTFVLSESHRAGDEKQFAINPLKNLCIPPFRKKSEKVSLAEGIPFTIQSEPINEGTFLDTYCTELFYSIEGFLDAAESSLARHLLKLLEDLDNERDVKESLCGLKKEIRKIKLDSKSPIILLLNNVSEACLYYLNNKKNKAKLKGRLSAFKSRVNKLLGYIDKIDIPLPFTGDCFAGTDSSYILYRPVKSTISREGSLLSEDVRKVVADKKTGNLVFYSQEKKRLTGLIAEIVSYPAGRPDKGKTPSKKMVIPSTHEEEPHTAVKPAPVRKKRAISPVKIIVPAAVIILLAVIFLLPPFSLLQKSLKRAEEKQKITEEVSTGESIVSEQPEETQAAVKEEELTAGKPTTTEQPEEIIIPEIDREKVESFLSLGYIQITILDVYYLTNKIAAANGYAELDSVEQLGKNPNWIYPGNVFVLPDETQYTVLKGDTIWHIAKRFIQKNLDRDWAAYSLLIEEIDSKNKNEIIAELKDLNKSSYSENFSKEINKTIDELKQNPELTD